MSELPSCADFTLISSSSNKITYKLGTSEKGDLVPPTKRRKMQQGCWFILIDLSSILVNGNNRIDNGGESVLTRETAERLGPPKRWLYCPPMGKVNSFVFSSTHLMSRRYVDFCLSRLRCPSSTMAVFPILSTDFIQAMCSHMRRNTVRLQISRLACGSTWRRLLDTIRKVRWVFLARHEPVHILFWVELRGAKFVKMPLAGHDEAPSRSDVDHFIQCVQAFRKVRFVFGLNQLCSIGPSRWPDRRALHTRLQSNWIFDLFVHLQGTRWFDGIFGWDVCQSSSARQVV